MFRPTDRVPHVKVDGDAGPHTWVRVGCSPPGRTDMGDDDRCTSPTRIGGVLEDLGEELRGDKACEGPGGLTPADGEKVGARFGTQDTELPRTSLNLFVQRSDRALIRSNQRSEFGDILGRWVSAKDVGIVKDCLSSLVMSFWGLHLKTEETNPVLPIP